MPHPLDEYPIHQAPLSLAHVVSSDRNAYDRCYFNAHGRAGEPFLITGLGIYPNLGLIDAYATVGIGGRQISLRQLLQGNAGLQVIGDRRRDHGLLDQQARGRNVRAGKPDGGEQHQQHADAHEATPRDTPANRRGRHSSVSKAVRPSESGTAFSSGNCKAIGNTTSPARKLQKA